MSVAVVVNPRSRANRRDPGLRARLEQLLGSAGAVLAPASLEELTALSDRLAQSPPEVVAIHGGDGTLHRTISALVRAFGGRPLPAVAILTGGTMNVVASSLGIRADPEMLVAELADLRRAGRSPETLSRRCLCVEAATAAGPPRTDCGFVFGNGLMASFLEEYYARGGYGALRAMEVMTRAFGSALVGGQYARKVFRRFEGDVWVDGERLPWRTLTGVGAATVREVGLGFKLNHRADEDPDRFSVLAIHAGPLHLAADLLPVHQGRGIAPDRAFSAVACRLDIEPADGQNLYTIDGDLYRAPGRLVVGLGPPLRFVVPRGR